MNNKYVSINARKKKERKKEKMSFFLFLLDASIFSFNFDKLIDCDQLGIITTLYLK